VIKLTVKDLVYKINIQHYDQSLTIVTISDGDVVRGTGLASRHHLDQFNKAIGRKIAFGRALEDAGFTKDQRTMLWNAYFEKVRAI
jgi:hypothetical protein